MVNVTHPSDSSAQRDAGREMLDALGSQLGVRLEKRRWPVSDDSYVEINGVDGDDRYVVQVHARLGALKVAQKHSVANDVLKLILVRDNAATRGRHPALILAFASREAADSVRGWLRDAIRMHGIDMRVVSLSEDTLGRVRAAQQRQVLGSSATPSTEDSDE